MDLLERLRAKGQSRQNTIAQHLPRYWPVPHSAELDRVLALPVEDRPEHPAVTQVERPGCDMPLYPIQRRALSAAAYQRGAFIPIPVGGGKTLVAALIPTVCQLKNALILTTAAMVRESSGLMRSYRKGFRLRRDFTVLSYDALSSPDQSGVLERLQPSAIIADECQALSNRDAARTGRFLRYMAAHPDVEFYALSGSITRRSILDYSHLLKLALARGSPLPRGWPEAVEWSEALDVGRSRDAGALKRFMGPDDKDVRTAYARRLRSTPGVVVGSGQSYTGPLKLETLPASAPSMTPAIRDALRTLRDAWETPDGRWLVHSIEYAAAERSLKLGGYYVQHWPKSVSPEAIERWKEARTEYARALRQFLRYRKKTGLDSPALIAAAVERDDASTAHLRPLYCAYQEALASIPPPVQRWRWVDRSVVEFAAEALATRLVQIVWSGPVAVGQAIAKLAGVPYFGAGDEGIMTYHRACVASWRAHGTGRNLQQYARALGIGVPSQGAQWEQLLGRQHRPGQKQPVHFYLLAREKTYLRKATRDAEYIEQTTGAEQKLLHCERI